MNVESAVMKVPYYDAVSAYHAYKRLVDERRATPDDVSLAKAYGRLVRGKKVIDARKAIVDAGVDANGRPRLAIGRAHWPFAHFWSDGARAYFTRTERAWSWRAANAQRQRSISAVFPVALGNSARAITPMVPAQHRPKGALSAYHILWEAEWQPVPPVDPLLLKHIDGPFFVVLAAWDLTPLEQAVMRQQL